MFGRQGIYRRVKRSETSKVETPGILGLGSHPLQPEGEMNSAGRNHGASSDGMFGRQGIHHRVKRSETSKVETPGILGLGSHPLQPADEMNSAGRNHGASASSSDGMFGRQGIYRRVKRSETSKVETPGILGSGFHPLQPAGEMNSAGRNHGASASSSDGTRGCFICGRSNHRSWSCTRRIYKDDADHYCFVCGDLKHYARVCPFRFGNDEANISKNSLFCYHCKHLGHLYRDCTNCTCSRCDKNGHLASECHSLCSACGWRAHRAKGCLDRPCRSCGDSGHFLQECPKITCNKCRRKGHKSWDCHRFCSICGVKGHLADDCCSKCMDAHVEGCSSLNQGEGHEGLIGIYTSSFSKCADVPVEGCSSLNQGEGHEGLIGIDTSSFSSSDCVEKSILPTKARIVIDILSSSETEDEEERELLGVDKYNVFLDVKVKVEEENSREKDEEDDCYILDFDPFHNSTINFKDKLSLSNEDPSTIKDDDEISIIAQRGQVACRDYPHSRHQCGNYPFDKTEHESFCPQCYCYVCDVIAPCAQWTGSGGHCHATDRVGIGRLNSHYVSSSMPSLLEYCTSMHW